jgi:(heptosyl)LPS beta-1,4-glucosyltransferase
MISAIVLTRNEERHLPDCLRTLHWADEVVVLDSGSTDNTLALAEQAGARIVTRPFTHFGDQREAALRLAQYPWVLFVDADERVPPALAEEIQQTVAANHPEVGWWIPRRNYFWGRQVRYSGWYPDYQLRLLRVDSARFDPDQHVHEVATLNGTDGYLQEPLLHINYESWREFWAKQRTYARHESTKLRAQGIPWKPHSVVLQPLRAFYRRFIRWQGWRDGLLGLQLALAMAFWEGVSYWGLRQGSK